MNHYYHDHHRSPKIADVVTVVASIKRRGTTQPTQAVNMGPVDHCNALYIQTPLGQRGAYGFPAYCLRSEAVWR